MLVNLSTWGSILLAIKMKMNESITAMHCNVQNSFQEVFRLLFFLLHWNYIYSKKHISYLQNFQLFFNKIPTNEIFIKIRRSKQKKISFHDLPLM